MEQFTDTIRRFSPVMAYLVIFFIASCIGSGDPGTTLLYRTLITSDPLPVRITGGIVLGSLAAIPPAVMLQLLCERSLTRSWKTALLPWLSLIVGIACAIWFAMIGGFGVFFSIIFIGIDLTCIFMSLWLLTTKDNDRELFGWLFKNGIIIACAQFVVLAVVGLIVAGFYALMLDGSSPGINQGAVIFISLVIVAGICLFCMNIPRYSDEITTTRAYQIVMAYVLLPLWVLNLIALYLTLAQYASSPTHDMHVVNMNWNALFALLGYVVLWLGLRMHHNHFVRQLMRWLWIAFVPFLVVQIYEIWIQFQPYGITTLRYYGYVCLALGIVAFVYAAIDKSPRSLFLVAAIVSLVVTVTPLNGIDVANAYQAHRLETALESFGAINDDGSLSPTDTDISDETAETINSSWKYLSDSETVYLHPKIVNQINEQVGGDVGSLYGKRVSPPRDSSDPGIHFTDYYHFELQDNQLDVPADSTIVPISGSDLIDNSKVTLDDSTGFTLAHTFRGATTTIDFSGPIEQLVNTYGKSTTTLSADQLTFDGPNGVTILLTNVDVTYYDYELQSVVFSGYYIYPR